ncbi:hypothetical protein KAI92_04080 [Candidatus Parcubacteria bacterium]|nr:hypothetical protein [Candidatus Parcubacteria bacterium]
MAQKKENHYKNQAGLFRTLRMENFPAGFLFLNEEESDYVPVDQRQDIEYPQKEEDVEVESIFL